VVTCEPGIYIMPLLLQRATQNPNQADFLLPDSILQHADFGGVRIEDNVALLPQGPRAGEAVNLTVEAGRAPKAVAEIEGVMAAAAAQRGASKRR